MAKLTIGEAEMLLRLPASTLRHWEKVLALVAPAKDNFGRRARGDQVWHLGRRIAVQGHYKMQRHGPELRLRKLIFIRPHSRGPINGAPLHKMIRVRA